MVDVLASLIERTAFIRRFYDAAAAPFRDTKRKIEDGEEPYVPGFFEDGEPPFLQEWEEAETSLEVLGIACVSMLSESLKLYFREWEKLANLDCSLRHKRVFKDRGFLFGYKVCFEHTLKLDWTTCTTDFGVLEQIILARHRGQHPGDIGHLVARHSVHDLGKYPRPLFASDVELDLLDAGWPSEWLTPTIVVTRENLFAAIDQIDALAAWLEERLLDIKYPNRPKKPLDV